jgi:hypothetical protein
MPPLQTFRHRHYNIITTIKTYTNRQKPKEMCNKILRKKSKLSMKMSWHTFAKKMNAFAWYRST